MKLTFPQLLPTLKAEGYELLMTDRPSQEYLIMKSSKLIGKIYVTLKCVEAYTGTEIYNIPYDVEIRVIKSSEDLPIELFKKIIMVSTTTVTIS